MPETSRWKGARAAKGWSTREAAKLAGVSASLVSRVENGHEIQFAAGVALAHAYGVSPMWLAGIDGAASTTPSQRVDAVTAAERSEAYGLLRAIVGCTSDTEVMLIAARFLDMDATAIIEARRAAG